MENSFQLIHYVRIITKKLLSNDPILNPVQFSASFCSRFEEILYVIIHYFLNSLVYMLHQKKKKTAKTIDFQIIANNSFPSQLRNLILHSMIENLNNFETNTKGSQLNRAKLTVSPPKCRKIFKSLHDIRLPPQSPVVFASIIDVLITEIMKLVLKKSNDLQLQRLTAEHLNHILSTNAEFSSLMAFSYNCI